MAVFPKVSIITVCQNVESLIEYTLRSVLNQTYTHIEYIIVDGKSTDNTLKIINDITHKPAVSSPIIILQSEFDKGIYDAMNKALALATGDYVWFINAGDEIYEPTTLEKLIPYFQKNADVVQAETEMFIRKGGYREITLSSLSSGDYDHLDSLIDCFNRKYREERISFQLPSLKVSGFSLNLLEKVSRVRKSGLTFAVETPDDFRQMAINKQVSGEDVVSILKEAKKRGWRTAKFYFMIGLPLEEGEGGLKSGGLKSEEEEIIDFIEKTAVLAKMHFNINIGTFIPKPHTPYQWAAQLSRDESEKKLDFLRTRLKAMGHKVGLQDPLISVIEGIASRGDERAGEIFEEAFRLGCRLDSWSEYLKRDVWETILLRYKDLVKEILGRKEIKPLPWSFVDSGIGEKHLVKELEKSKAGEITLSCIKNCTKSCEICGLGSKIVKNIIQYKHDSEAGCHNDLSIMNPNTPAPAPTYRIIFSFSKKGSAVFHSHLGLIEIFSMSFLRANIQVKYTQGFNPLPRLDIASPLSVGIIAGGEIASIDTEFFFEAEQFRTNLNEFLPEGIEIIEAMNIHIKPGVKKHSVSSLLWGFVYKGQNGQEEIVDAKNEKSYRLSRKGSDGSNYDLERISVLARKEESYFDVYRELYIQGKSL